MPGPITPPHDHQIPAIIGMDRRAELNYFYEIGFDDRIHKSSEIILSAGEVLQIDPSYIHAVGCASNEPYCGIHVYLGRLTAVERSLFDLTTGETLPFMEESYHRLINSD